MSDFPLQANRVGVPPSWRQSLAAMFFFAVTTVAGVAAAQTACQINITKCRNLPSYVGIVSDNYNNSSANQNACMQRPQQIYEYCGGGAPVAASFLSNGHVVQSLCYPLSSATNTSSSSSSSSSTSSTSNGGSTSSAAINGCLIQ